MPAQMHALLTQYLTLTDRARPEYVRLPKPAIDRLKQLLCNYSPGINAGLAQEDPYKCLVKITDTKGRDITRLFSWILSMCAVLMQARSELDSSPSWKKRALF
jgi:hypothetical protein